MKHQIIIVISSLALMLGATSCSDTLDITPDGRLTLDEVFANPDYAEAYLANAFVNIPNKMHWYFWFDNLPTALSDESWSNEDVEGHGAILAYRGQGSSSENVFETEYHNQFDAQYWRKYWASIRILNVFLERIPTAAVNSESARSRMIADAKVLRAYYYLQLVKWYGDLPLITESLSPSASFADYRRQPAHEILAYITNDCLEAMECNDLPWRLTNVNEYRRMSRAIAAAIASQASLFAASKLYCHGQNLWKWAYDVNTKCLSALRANGYELYTVQQTTNYNSAYGEYFAQNDNVGTNPIDRETIMSSSPRGNHPLYYVNGTPIQNAYVTGDVPSQELVDAYDMLQTGLPVVDIDNPYLDPDHLEPNYVDGSGYKPKDPYKGRDPRFEACILHNSSKIYVGDNQAVIKTEKGGNCEVRANSRTYTRTGYYPYKYHHFSSCAARPATDGRWKYFRLGEVILNCAECAAENGDVTTAMQLVNEIRHRAGFDPSVDVKADSKERAISLVRHERRIELAFEENRFFDVRRWTSNEEDIPMEGICTGMQIEKKGFSSTYTRFVVGTKASAAAKWHFLPIPLAEASTLEEQTGVSWQNYGW